MYKYHCESCDTVFAMLAKEDSESVSCPKCENESRKHNAFEIASDPASDKAATRVYGFG